MNLVFIICKRNLKLVLHGNSDHVSKVNTYEDINERSVNVLPNKYPGKFSIKR